MDLSNYAGLQAAIASYLKGRNDLTEKIKGFIRLGERRAYRELRVREMEARTDLTPAASIALPSDFVEDISVTLPGRGMLQKVEPEDLDVLPSGTNGVPTGYAIEGSTLLIGPDPVGVDDIRLRYFARPAWLSDSATTNAILTNYPDVLLYAAMKEAAVYLIDDERTTVWRAMYLAGIEAANAESMNARRSKVRSGRRYGGLS